LKTRRERDDEVNCKGKIKRTKAMELRNRKVKLDVNVRIKRLKLPLHVTKAFGWRGGIATTHS
jgi:hypothetical protein